MSGPNKGPQGKSDYGQDSYYMPEPQERYEEEGEHPDLVGGEPTQDPTSLKAHEEDHTPNHTKGPKPSKIGWNFNRGRGDGGVGL